MSTIIFLRHGETDYTDVFPDLTQKGIGNAERAGNMILKIMRENDVKSTRIISSPYARTMGTATCIAKRINFSGKIKEEPQIRASDFYDREVAISYWNSKGDSVVSAKNYLIDPWFNTGIYVEKRDDVASRFANFTKDLLWEVTSGESFDLTIVVSHFECLWKLVEKFGFQEPISYCELVVLEIGSISNSISLTGYYRGSSLSFECELRGEVPKRLMYV